MIKTAKLVTEISITPIPVDRPPFPLPFGAEFPMYYTVQPGGAYIEPYGARIIYPNITNEPPGTRINFWNYDSEEKGWHIYGRGTVTPDGKQVVPDEGVAIYELAGASIKPFGTGPGTRRWLLRTVMTRSIWARGFLYSGKPISSYRTLCPSP